MARTWKMALAIPFAGAAVAAILASGARAADHIDGPAATQDPASDLTDVYAFMSPDPATPKHLVLIMNVVPFAAATSKFSDKVDYLFHVKPITNAATLATGADANVKCNFTGASVSCTGPNGLTATGTVGTVGGAATDDMRVFAGERSDPFYFDLQAFKDSVAAGTPKFTSPGHNKFDGANVMSIVVEIDAVKAFGGDDAGAPNAILAVAAETTRTGN